MNARAVLQILDDLAQEAYASGEDGPAVDLDAYTARILDLADERSWIGDATTALDQAYSETTVHDGRLEPAFWHDRAQAAAAIASAEQALAGNLIAWKALRQAASTSSLPTSGDDVTDRIEQILGIQP